MPRTQTLIVDLEACTRELLEDRSYIKSTLLALVELLQMTVAKVPIFLKVLGHLCRIYHKPVIILRYPELDGSGGFGTTAFVPIVESFIVMDIWPEDLFATVHICSCKNYSIKKVVNFLETRFECVVVEQYQRGGELR